MFDGKDFFWFSHFFFHLLNAIYLSIYLSFLQNQQYIVRYIAFRHFFVKLHEKCECLGGFVSTIFNK